MVYRAEKADCRRFPTPASRDLAGGASRNFQVFDALDFLAELTQHIPDKGEHLVRFFGWYSYRRRGIRAKEASSDEVKIDRRLVDEARSAAKRQSSGAASIWAALVNRVFEVDPLECPQCGSRMKSSVSSNVANETLSKRSCGIVVCGRGRCEHWPRPGRHRRRGTRIENRLSRASSNWYSIRSICSEYQRPFQTRRTAYALGMCANQAVETPRLPKTGPIRLYPGLRERVRSVLGQANGPHA